jgi:hypothetical protein
MYDNQNTFALADATLTRIGLGIYRSISICNQNHPLAADANQNGIDTLAKAKTRSPLLDETPATESSAGFISG